MDGLRITAVVPATNEPETLDACLAAIEAAADGPDETVVVREPGTLGPAGARNRGAARARGDVLVFVDADVLVHPDVFSRVRAAFDDPELEAMFGSYDDDPADRRVVSSFRNLLHHHVHQASAGRVASFWAGVGAIRRQKFMETGGFDSRYQEALVEDIEFGMRLADLGVRVELDPALQGTHLKSWSVSQMVRTDVFGRGVPWVALLIRHRKVPLTLNLGMRERLSATSVVAAPALLASGVHLAAAIVMAAFVALNATFYSLLWRSRGPGHALLGVPLHALHHLCAVAAVPLGVLAYMRARRSARAAPPAVARRAPET
jgi:GT2 family glycosyltransferase